MEKQDYSRQRFVKSQDDRQLGTDDTLKSHIDKCVRILSECSNVDMLQIVIQHINVLKSLLRTRLDEIYTKEIGTITKQLAAKKASLNPGQLKNNKYDLEYSRVYQQFEALIGVAHRAGYMKW